jgi:hypothetical protein
VHRGHFQLTLVEDTGELIMNSVALIRQIKIRLKRIPNVLFWLSDMIERHLFFILFLFLCFLIFSGIMPRKQIQHQPVATTFVEAAHQDLLVRGSV